ncbi:MAG: response regulator, partial [Dehalococcoidia bacterium]
GPRCPQPADRRRAIGRFGRGIAFRLGSVFSNIRRRASASFGSWTAEGAAESSAVAPAGAVVAIVDSSEILVRAITELLHGGGYQAIGIVKTLSDDAQQVVTQLELLDPAVCIYDVQHPGTASVAAAASLRMQLDDCRFVLTTTDPSRLQRLLGARDQVRVLSKPFTAGEILAAVRASLEA